MAADHGTLESREGKEGGKRKERGNRVIIMIKYGDSEKERRGREENIYAWGHRVGYDYGHKRLIVISGTIRRTGSMVLSKDSGKREDDYYMSGLRK